jgi:hypothetical protein
MVRTTARAARRRRALCPRGVPLVVSPRPGSADTEPVASSRRDTQRLEWARAPQRPASRPQTASAGRSVRDAAVDSTAVLRLPRSAGPRAVGLALQRGPDAGADDPAEEQQLTAAPWIERHGPTIAPALSTQLQAVELPAGMPFVTWASGSSSSRPCWRRRSPSAGPWKRLTDLAAPTSPLGDVDQARGVDPAGTGPPAYNARVVDACTACWPRSGASRSGGRERYRRRLPPSRRGWPIAASADRRSTSPS